MKSYCPTCCAGITQGVKKCPVCGTELNWSRIGGKMITHKLSEGQGISVCTNRISRSKGSKMKLLLQIIQVILGISGIILTVALIVATFVLLRLFLLL